ncbi:MULTISPECIES: DUF2218 domain-containing protein [unclassified Crossiella]|uniref:DUF2218 domain-containing protein n=1 Tax=unclassified Crossiella TaxID=2620835 RepID=UPI00200033C9|nr:MULTISPECIES: DUF2218 domain-containing protein [unclassified Crossiella]MCK2243307.1 DUF2218 domain-containing protein [Crossiella sp. S99.2]MCK2254224.1 DUF2218 domain-containing protein [Crossiella sp. S99.1]
MTTNLISAEAAVTTDRPGRYLTQLCKHFAHKIESAEFTEERGDLKFAAGSCELTAEDGVLRLRVHADSTENLDRMEHVVASHLVRFGQRDELVVTWTRR